MAYTDIDKPSDYFNTLLYTGDDADRSFTGVGFQPDLTWIKARNNTTWHLLYDAVRTAGTGKELHSNSTQTEGASNSSLYGYLSSFDSDGFSTVNGSNATDALNQSGKTYAAWNWKAGTSFTNDASATGIGSIDSSGSVNQDAGFSICSYTGAGGVITVKHGLNTVPSVIITKNLADANHWGVYHHKNTTAPQTDFLYLSDTRATTDDATMWNDTAPTSSIFTAGDHSSSNRSGDAMIAYCFAEKQGYSKFGSYTGNGNADGTFVYTGLKPAFVMIKVTSTTSNWGMFDNKRLGFNPKNEFVRANENTTESSDYDGIDFLSNGFKLKTTSTLVNAAQSYIYMAFAENPFVTSTGVPATAR